MADSTKRKIFLVDDDASHSQMLKDHLSSKLNASITTFSNGEDCLNNLDQQPNIVVLDFHLDSEKKGAMNGMEILKKIKSAKPEVEVVMLSAQDKIEIAVDLMKHGAFDYVVKNATAFVRTQNAILNVFKNLKLQENLKAYKFSTFFLAGVIIAIIAAAIILVATGIASKNPGWVG